MHFIIHIDIKNSQNSQINWLYKYTNSYGFALQSVDVNTHDTEKYWLEDMNDWFTLQQLHTYGSDSKPAE